MYRYGRARFVSLMPKAWLCMSDSDRARLRRARVPGRPPFRLRASGSRPALCAKHVVCGLKTVGFHIVCPEARQASAALSALRNKLYRNNARAIAKMLRTGWFSSVDMKSREAQGICATIIVIGRAWALFETYPICKGRLPWFSSLKGCVSGREYVALCHYPG